MKKTGHRDFQVRYPVRMKECRDKTGEKKHRDHGKEILHMKTARTWMALLMAIVITFACTAAFARTFGPDDSDYDDLPGITCHATVGAYDEFDKTLQVTLYADDLYEIDDLEKIGAGDRLIAGGRVYTVAEKQEDEYGDFIVKCEDGMEIVFSQAGDDKMTAQILEDDRRFMHAFAILYLPAAGNITLEDSSDPDAEAPTVYTGLEEILKVKAEKEENSIGLDYYATVITLNGNMEIERIAQDFDVAQ